MAAPPLARHYGLRYVHVRTHAKSTYPGPNFFYENRHGRCMHLNDRREPSKRRPATPPGGSLAVQAPGSPAGSLVLLRPALRRLNEQGHE